jgi:multicomponent Na+:H+ antiporter subunit E
MKRLYYAVRYAAIFLRELVVANIQVAQAVLRPKLGIRPGFLAVALDAETDFEITVFANSITLTPGTISVHVAADHRTLVIHALDVGEDPEGLRRSVKETLEANILKWTRPVQCRSREDGS